MNAKPTQDNGISLRVQPLIRKYAKIPLKWAVGDFDGVSPLYVYDDGDDMERNTGEIPFQRAAHQYQSKMH